MSESEHPAVAFLEEAWARAEETARAAASDSGGEEWTDGGKYGDNVHVRDSNSYVAIGPWGCGLSDGLRMHVALHDPAAVLRRIAAEREMLAEHRPATGYPEDFSCYGMVCGTCARADWSGELWGDS